MTSAAASAPECVFCAIAAGQADASVVHQDDHALVFMDLYPVTPGHLVVVPRAHATGLEDLDPATSSHLWSLGGDMARALRRSELRAEGINLLVCDGEAAFQTVFHFHLHVIPRYADDGWTLSAEETHRERSLLDRDAEIIRSAVAGGGQPPEDLHP